MSNLDMGEQFLYFPLDPKLWAYCRIDVRPCLRTPVGQQRLWFQWSRCMMGLMSSPYVAIKGTHLAEDFVFGDRFNPRNPFRWETIHLNLPGMPAHDPTQPWVARRHSDGQIAAGALRFIDNVRLVGPSEEECWLATHTLASRYGYLGLQIATRKTRPPSQCQGAWAGSHVIILDGSIGITCGIDKWAKAQRLLHELHEEFTLSPRLHHKSLEQKRGFFVHLQWTYPCITPFLKGMHLTIDSWQPGRDLEGWRTHQPTPDADMAIEWGLLDASAPEFMTAVRPLSRRLCRRGYGGHTDVGLCSPLSGRHFSNATPTCLDSDLVPRPFPEHHNLLPNVSSCGPPPPLLLQWPLMS
jgi:hypothetical protein